MAFYDVPVYLIDPGTNFVNIPVDEAMHDLRVAVDAWREHSVADFRPYYAGKIAPTSLVANTVQVRETSNCDICPDEACEKTVYTWPAGYRASTIWVEQLDPICPGNNDRDYTRHSEDPLSLDALFTHEIGHAWGLEDEYEFPPGVYHCDDEYLESAMASNCPNGRYVTRRDVAALQTLYPTRQRTYKTRVSTDGALSWQAGPTDTGMINAIARQTSLGTMSSSATREVLSRPFFGFWSAYYPYPYTRFESGNTGSTFSSSVPWLSPSGYSWDVGGAAMKATNNYAIVYRPYEDEDDCQKGVVVSLWNGTSAINREAREIEPNTFYSMTDGASIAYDPAADVYVAVFTNNDYELSFQLIDPVTGNRIGFQTLPAFGSYYSPAVACNTAAYAGQYNCMVAWRRYGELDPIRYVRVYFSRTDTPAVDFVNPSSGTASALTVETFQSPSLTHYPSSTRPFILGTKEGSKYSTWRYSSSSGTFVDKRTAIDVGGGSMLSGALGVQSGRVIIRYAEL